MYINADKRDGHIYVIRELRYNEGYICLEITTKCVDFKTFHRISTKAHLHRSMPEAVFLDESAPVIIGDKARFFYLYLISPFILFLPHASCYLLVSQNVSTNKTDLFSICDFDPFDGIRISLEEKLFLRNKSVTSSLIYIYISFYSII